MVASEETDQEEIHMPEAFSIHEAIRDMVKIDDGDIGQPLPSGDTFSPTSTIAWHNCMGGTMHKSVSVLLLLCLSTFALAEDIELGRLQANEYNEFLKNQVEKDIMIRYDTETKEAYLVTKDIFGFAVMRINEAQMPFVDEALAKYQDWNAKAIAKKVKLDKEIGELSFPYSWQFGDSWNNADSDPLVSFRFFSQQPTRHQLCFVFPRLTSSSNQFITKTPETLYFDADQVIQLRTLLSKKHLEKTLHEHAKQKKIDDEFQ